MPKVPIPGAELDALLAQLELDPAGALARPRSVRGALRAAGRLIAEHIGYSLALGLGVAGAGELIIDVLALGLAVVGVEQSFGWALSAYLVLVCVLLNIGALIQLLDRAGSDRQARRHLELASSPEAKPWDFKGWHGARGRLECVREMRAGAAKLAAMIRYLPLPPAVEIVEGRRWRIEGFVGSKGPLAVVITEFGSAEFCVLSTYERAVLEDFPDDESEADSRAKILAWLEVSEASARPKVDLRACVWAFWSPIALWLLVWVGLFGWALSWLWTQLPAPGAAFAGYPVVASSSVILLGWRTHLAPRWPLSRRPLLTAEEHAAAIYEDPDNLAAVKRAHRDARRRARKQARRRGK